MMFLSESSCFIMLFTQQERCYHFPTAEIIVESVSLMQMTNRIEEYYHHDGEQLGFYKKVQIKTHTLSKKKHFLVIFILQETNNVFLFFFEKCHIQHEES